MSRNFDGMAPVSRREPGSLCMDDDFAFPELLDDAEAEGNPTAGGIVQCLRMLADEAVALGLDRTLTALRTAIAVCAAEGGAVEATATADPGSGTAMLTRPAGTTLH